MSKHAGEKDNQHQGQSCVVEGIQKIRHRSRKRLIRSLRGDDKEGIREVGHPDNKMRGPMARTSKEEAVDRFLTLYLANDGFSRKGLRSLPATRLQKLVFLSERAMIDERRKGFNFRFIKLTYGPFSQELKGDAEKIVRAGLLHGNWHVPTDGTRILLDDFHDVIKKNDAFVHHIRTVNDVYALMPLRQLLNVIHGLPWRGGKTINDLPPRTPMLYPMKPERVVSEFDMTDDEADDLLMNFDPKAVNDLVQAMKEMRTGKLRTYEQAFCGLPR